MLTLTSDIFFRSNPYGGSEDIEKVILNLDDETIEQIKWAAKTVSENSYIFSINISISDEDVTHVAPFTWKKDVCYLIVYNDRFVYYAQNKYDSADQIESRGFLISELN